MMDFSFVVTGYVYITLNKQLASFDALACSDFLRS